MLNYQRVIDCQLFWLVLKYGTPKSISFWSFSSLKLSAILVLYPIFRHTHLILLDSWYGMISYYIPIYPHKIFMVIPSAGLSLSLRKFSPGWSCNPPGILPAPSLGDSSNRAAQRWGSAAPRPVFPWPLRALLGDWGLWTASKWYHSTV